MLQVCTGEISTLAIDHVERTAFAGSYDGELVQLLLTSTAVQPYRKLTARHGVAEITGLANMAAWGAGGSRTSDGIRRDPEVERHGSLLLSLAADGSVAVTSVHEGCLLLKFGNPGMGEASAIAASSSGSLIAIGGASDGEGLLWVHKLTDSRAVRTHSPLTPLAYSDGEPLAEVTSLAFLPTDAVLEVAAGGGEGGSGIEVSSPALHRMLIVGDAASHLIIYDVHSNGRPPIPLHSFKHPGPRTSWLSATRNQVSKR